LKKLVIILLALAMFSMVSVPSVRAQDIEGWVSVDKNTYEPGEQGAIYITIRNTGDDPIEVKNVTIEFTDWMIYTEDGWDPLGNKTIVYDPVIIVSSETAVALDEITFTIPNDARGHSTSVDLSIYTNKGKLHTYAIKGWNNQIQVMDAYSLRYLKAMDNIVTLLTVVSILAIISAIIIAAAIFLSGRRPRVTWQKEE